MDTNQSYNSINLDDYNYILPDERIAFHQLKDRGSSKLLVGYIRENKIVHSNFSEIQKYLPKNTLIVINNTKVIPARFKMIKEGGGKSEILCLEPIQPSTEPTKAMAAVSPVIWKCMIGGSRINPGKVLKPRINVPDTELIAEILERSSNEALVEFRFKPDNLTFSGVMSLYGATPLPPYIKREAERMDSETYQTVYAKNDGSVAAPTAGLHFTPQIMGNIIADGSKFIELTLHVGSGTFLPISSNNITEHIMHSEMFSISKESLQSIYVSLNNGTNIIATGTTSVRTLESIHWLGVDLILNSEGSIKKYLEQWDWTRNSNRKISALQSFGAVLEYLEKMDLSELKSRTQLCIVPGYEFKVINGMITNYHLPKSTLVLLVAAFTGYEFWKKSYSQALNSGYRFLSYGDSMLLLK